MPNRRSIRLPGYDYAQNGAYFVTICAKHKIHYFGEIDNKTCTIQLSQYGKIAEQCWFEIQQHYQNVELDAFVIMPNHIHGVVLIQDVVVKKFESSSVGVEYFQPWARESCLCDKGCVAPSEQRAEDILPLRENKFQRVLSGSLSAIIRGYKIGVTKGCRNMYPDCDIWQRNFYEHVIRDKDDLGRIREYIEYNPGSWLEDEWYS